MRDFLVYRLGWCLLLASTACAADPVVSNVRVSQQSGKKLVDITYNVSDSDSSSLSVLVAISTNDGTTFGLPAPSMSDAGSVKSIGNGVTPGNDRKVVWNAGADWNGQFSSVVRAKITADDSMVLIPAGNFSMGDNFYEGGGYEQPVHTVYVSAFLMDKYEVTKAKWDEVYSWAISHAYSFNNAGSSKSSAHPVQTVNWYDCVKWCNARSQKEGRTPCYTVSGNVYKTGQSEPDCAWSANGYRLPTEAEWEKAARGGVSGRRFPWSDVDTIQHGRANYYSVSSTNISYDTSPTRGYHPLCKANGNPYTSPVGAFAPNGYGLYDMAGNVWECCWDWIGPYNSGSQTDPHGPATVSGRVLRGGCCLDLAYNSRVAYRIAYGSSTASELIGFRAVMHISP
jgi:formylglycine-generating enzyme required for sulfatase activity